MEALSFVAILAAYGSQAAQPEPGIAAAQHMPELQAAFSCKADAERVRAPDKRCAVW